MVKNKLKPLLPCLKERKRYLAFRIISKPKIEDFNVVSSSIQSSCHELIGSLGMAKAGVQVIKERWNEATQTGLIRVCHNYVNELKAALTFIKTMNNQEVIVSSIGVSGILNKAEKKYLN